MYENYLNIANLLIKSGANLEITDEEGQTPLHVLASTSVRYSTRFGVIGTGDSVPLNAIINTAKLLIKKGANINAVDNKNDTPLHIALRDNDFEFGYLLKEAGANIELMNNDGQTPIQSINARFDDNDAGQIKFRDFLKKKSALNISAKKITKAVRKNARDNVTEKVEKTIGKKINPDVAHEIAKFVVSGKRTRRRRHSKDKQRKKTRHSKDNRLKKTRHSKEKPLTKKSSKQRQITFF